MGRCPIPRCFSLEEKQQNNKLFNNKCRASCFPCILFDNYLLHLRIVYLLFSAQNRTRNACPCNSSSIGFYNKTILCCARGNITLRKHVCCDTPNRIFHSRAACLHSVRSTVFIWRLYRHLHSRAACLHSLRGSVFMSVGQSMSPFLRRGY